MIKHIKDYILLTRCDKPIGIYLLLLPCLWSLSLALPHSTLFDYVIFILGSIFMRGAGCIYNDIVDQKFDKQVERTKYRPLVRIDKPLPLKLANIYLFIHLSISFFIFLNLRTYSQIISVIALLMVFVYPWMKRITYWPQIFLGLTFNIGILVGYAHATNSLNFASIILYIGGIFWTLAYDTIYAYQDIEDDIKINVKSSVQKVKNPRIFLSICYLITLICLVIVGITEQLSFIYKFSVFLSGLHFLWQIFTLKTNESYDCLIKFKSNAGVGVIIFIGIFLSKI